ncbi:MAG: hypothetical protein HQ581_21300, partial [Planctomycetes bacterium]|nr:hypothetical protein [Planctomycetota bacterium]
MASFSRTVPDLVEQDRTRHTCWAAAVTSWVKATPKSPARWWLNSQEDAISQYEMFCNSKGGLSVSPGMQWLAAGVGMGLKVYKKASGLDGSYLYWRLATRGHLFLLLAGGSTGLGNTLGHAVVVYKITSGSGGYSLGVMDPWPGMG